MKQQRLNEVFNCVRKTIFPLWDRKKDWKVVFDPNLPRGGVCFPEIKTIKVQQVHEDDDELRELLIHEICHSSAPDHGKRWGERMMGAANRAQKAGWL